MVALIGKSGTGKSRIERALINEGYKKIVSYCTRTPRVNDVEGLDYHFITKEKYHQLFEEGFFAEYVMYADNYYAVAKQDCKDDTLIIVNKDGLMQFKNIKDINVTSFYLTTNIITRFRRMIKRGDKLLDIIYRLKYDYKEFKGLEKEVDYIIENKDGDYGKNKILEILKTINK